MFKTAVISLLLGLVTLLAGIQIFYLPATSTERSPSLDWNAALARVEIGEGAREENNLRLQLNESGRGLISLPTPRFKSADYPFLHLSLADSTQNLSVMILWRTTGGAEKVYNYQIPGDAVASLWLDAKVIIEWTDEITSLGVAVMGQPGSHVIFTDVSVHPSTLIRQLQVFYQDWTDFSPWRHSSINTHKGINFDTTYLYPVPVLAVLLTLSLLAYGVLLMMPHVKMRFDWRVVSFIFLFCWMCLDVVWQGKMLRQLSQTYETFYGRDTEGKLAVGIDAELTGFISQVRQQLESDNPRIFVGSSSDYLGMRGAYYLYPFNVFWERNGPELPSRKYLDSGDYIVLIKPAQTNFEPSKQQLLTPVDEIINVEPIFSDRMGSLFRVQ